MSYIDFEYYKNLYGDASEDEFYVLSWDACRKIDVLTTGVDGVKKLKIAFPKDEDDAEAVRRCVCKLVQVMQEINEAERIAISASGFSKTEEGLQGKVVSSKSAGNVSISYSVNSGAETSIGKAVSDRREKDMLLNSIVIECLSGVSDANGVNLLYMGRYPYITAE